MHDGLNSAPFTGLSMKPLLKSGDEILYQQISAPISVGDILLFKDPVNSEFVAHRVIKLDPLSTKGDWSCHQEQLAQENIFGLIVGLKRDGNSYFFSKDTNLINALLFLSKNLLLKNKLRRQLSRLCLISLKPFMLKKNDL